MVHSVLRSEGYSLAVTRKAWLLTMWTSGDEDEILRLLPGHSEWKSWLRKLQEAERLRSRAWLGRSIAVARGRVESKELLPTEAVKRNFEPHARDFRRKELRGLLPIEQIRVEPWCAR